MKSLSISASSRPSFPLRFFYFSPPVIRLSLALYTLTQFSSPPLSSFFPRLFSFILLSLSSPPQVSSLLGDPSRLLLQKALGLRPPAHMTLGKGLLGDSPIGEWPGLGMHRPTSPPPPLAPPSLGVLPRVCDCSSQPDNPTFAIQIIQMTKSVFMEMY